MVFFLLQSPFEMRIVFPNNGKDVALGIKAFKAKIQNQSIVNIMSHM